ncbi:trigger factor [Rhodoblastus acidophilus]|uniref:Trigger factor n=1 Tax=Candidatus Rhodoblastus alkanivorans TaxID=2954117 RepID=A0ABS9Z5F5_9HYPH|nr:trigger factor [Candidatus Rhodoblastus alkanivorans]MCI4678463.1 trigger factor [Candidatus Rhodoblastus alkanivorans]MCI4682864.1 trigger factor [Candidatus Rhodoblastus alkanivorans]MDI4640173.1 trigger factor [Rhodoblastus acidophilus]
MQTTETLSQGLKREYQVVLAAAELAEKLEAQLAEMKDKVRINGFRPGKVPASHLKRLYGKSIMGDVVQQAVTDAQNKILSDNNMRLAGQPKLDFPEDRDEMEKVLEATGDLSFKIAFEVLPSFEVGSFEDIELERLVAEVPEEEIEQQLKALADGNRAYADREEGAEAQNGDKLTIDFVGRIGDEAFEGGAAEGVDLVLGSGSFIPGFEAQLEGAKVGDERKVTVTFPEDYQAAHLAGKEAVFDVTVKVVAAPQEVAIDDELAKKFGLESLDKLREAVIARIKADYDRASREKLKRALLDALDKKFDFELPQDMVEHEFNGIWGQIQAEQNAAGKTFADEGTTEEAQRAEYRRIAERRVRLGLVVAEVGDKAGVRVGDDEVTRAIVERARQFPGQEKLFWEYYQKNPQALAEIRAPIYEEKVVDHIVGQAKVTDKTVAKEELFKAEDEEKTA